jgi:hypothetical protein
VETKQAKRSTDVASDIVAGTAPARPAMFVARGRTVLLNNVAHGPGTPLSLEADEEKHLVGAGFLVAAPPILEPMSQLEAASRNPRNIGLQDTHQKFQGPVYNR